MRNILFILLFVQLSFEFCIGQTVTQNFVQERSPRIPGLTTESLVDASSSNPDNVQSTITYFEGLGKKVQTVSVKASPMFKDVVTPFDYDVLGREAISYLTYAEQYSADGSFKTSALSSQSQYYSSGSGWDVAVKKTSYPFANKIYENSPLSRIKVQGFAGNAWQPYNVGISGSGHTVQFDYVYNTVSGGSYPARLYGVTSGSLTGTSTFYPANTLRVTITKDENWTGSDGKAGTTEEYRDKIGKLILKRIFNKVGLGTIETLSTYYVYDDYGNLCFVLPPGASPDSGTVPTAASLNNFCYQYQYDDRSRLIKRRLPSKGWEELVYNNLDQLVLTQDPIQFATNKWSFIKYDAHGRVIITGVINSSKTRTEWQDDFLVSNFLYETRDNGNDYHTNIGYTNNALPYHNIVESYLTVNYYGTYDFYENTLGGSITGESSVVPSLLTGTKVAVFGSPYLKLTTHYYDQKGQVVRTLKQHYLDGAPHVDNYDEIINTYNFPGDLLSSTRVHHASSGNITISNRYEYDHVGRKKHTFSNIAGAGEVMLSRLRYNEVGQLKQKDLHSTDNGTTFMQSIDYSYNERGWMSKINDPLNVTTNRVFGMELLYGNKSDAFNGNIGGVSWQTMVPAGLGLTQQLQSNVYDYDKLNRLVKSGYTTSGATDKFNEEMTYDMMGNIITLKRKNAVSGYLNDFTYNYVNAGVSGNRLMGITDAGAAAQSANYTYNINGNLETDSYKGLNYHYNVLNLPTSIVKSGVGSIDNLYDGVGNKLKKTVGSDVRHYIDGIEYHNGAIDFILTEEGRAVPGTSYTYEYMLKDHLGNVRATVKQNQDIIQVQDYYAFGMEMATGNTLSPSRANEYKYNGKELQNELGLDQLDYGARFYDPVIGRWSVIDPLAEKYFSLTPYQYAGNTPTNAIDIGGKLFIFVNGLNPGEWFSTKFPASVPNQYGTISLTNMNVSNRMDRDFHRGGNNDYWGDVSQNYMEAFSDKNAYWVNGSYTPKSSASLRYNQGIEAGQRLIKMLDAGKISLKEGESIKIVGHSQGAAYAAGIASTLVRHKKYGGLMEFVDYISPHQPGHFKHPKGVEGRQFSTRTDKISSTGPMSDMFGDSDYQKIDGAEWGMERESSKTSLGGHEIGSWLNNLLEFWMRKGNTIKVR